MKNAKKMASTTMEIEDFGLTMFSVDGDITQEELDASVNAGWVVMSEMFRICVDHLEEFKDPDMAELVKEAYYDMFKEEDPGE